MKVVILAGGFGTRISEESHLRPKPMIEIGDRPILWHIMKEYSYFGFNDFIICAGYKQHIIKEYFANYYLYNSDVTFDFSNSGKLTVHSNVSEPWRVTVVDTGYATMTGGRIKRIRDYVDNETFFMTYGDGVSDINIPDLLAFHRKKKRIATVTAILAGQRFGVFEMNHGDSDIVSDFREKALEDGYRINGGYMVLEPEVFDYIEGDQTFFEREPMRRLARDGQLAAFRHDGFWKCMDTAREREELADLVVSGRAPWMRWERKQ